MDTAEKPAQSARQARPVARAVKRPAMGTAKPAARPEERVTNRVVLAMQGVTKSYPNGRVALRDVDLIIPEGDFVFLLSLIHISEPTRLGMISYAVFCLKKKKKKKNKK